MSVSWWSNAIGYEVYVRSFQDSNGDGIGDLTGATSRLEHLAWLGIDIVWLTPFYPSPQADFGYDVADYCAVDPQFGDLSDLDEFVRRSHELGLRVLVDLVPNHTSDQHPWFDASRRGDPRYRSFYHWRDPRVGGGPPNNWVSHFGGPAWTLDAGSGQYYLHLFLPEQPDLNWANPAVAAAFDGVLHFWLDRGVDGFRVDVAQGLAKDMTMPDNPVLSPVDPAMSPREVFMAFEHRYDLDQPESKNVFRRWRTIADDNDALLLGEVYLRDGDPSKVARYVTDQDGLHRAFYFKPMHLDWDALQFRTTFGAALEAAGDSLSWALGSHDDPRAVSRFGGGDLGRARALAMATFMVMLPGLPFLYQGDELGLDDVALGPEDRRDPVALRSANPSDGRDGVRTPMPWSPTIGFGFTASESPWLPFGNREAKDTVEVQRSGMGSWLVRTRALIRVRRELLGVDASTCVEWLDAIAVGSRDGEAAESPSGGIVAYRRGEVICALNAGDRPVGLETPAGDWEVRFRASTGEPTDDDVGPAQSSAPIEVAPDDAVILGRR